MGTNSIHAATCTASAGESRTLFAFGAEAADATGRPAVMARHCDIVQAKENFSNRSPHFLLGFGAKSDRHKPEGRCMG